MFAGFKVGFFLFFFKQISVSCNKNLLYSAESVLIVWTEDVKMLKNVKIFWRAGVCVFVCGEGGC